MFDLAPAAQRMAVVAAGVRPDQLSGRTPCPAYTVSDLLNHIVGLTGAFRDAALKTGASQPPDEAMTQPLDPQWREVLPNLLDGLVAAWKVPEAWEGMTEAGGIALPGEVAAQVAVDELVIHGWDLARATGQTYECDADTTRIVFAFTEASARPDDADARDAIFGPVVEVPADAPLFDRALGYAGRDPAWSP